jgi:hypothetical protein
MYMACRHIMPNGRRCQSPALKSGLFCYFHARLHKRDSDPFSVYGKLRLPVPEDHAAIQLSISQICDALCAGRIDSKNAGRLLYAMQIASQNVDKCRFFTASRTVESATQTGEGDDLAPEERVCDGNDDCNGCPHAETCPNYDPDDDDDDDDDDD